jgi:hypothetical protein
VQFRDAQVQIPSRGGQRPRQVPIALCHSHLCPLVWCGADHRSQLRADAPGAEADSPQRLEGGLEQGVGPFGLGSKVRVDQVARLLVVGELAGGGFLDRDGRLRAEDLSEDREARVRTTTASSCQPYIMPGHDRDAEVVPLTITA